MSEVKNPIVRYQVLDKCLRDTTRFYSAVDLLNLVNQKLEERNGLGSSRSRIGRVQLHEDLKSLEELYGAEIEARKSPSDGRVKLYRYSDPSFSINSQPLSDQEAISIKNAIEILSRFQGLPQFEQISEIIPALHDRFGTKNSGADTIIEFSSNKYLEGLEHLTPVYNAITNQRVLDVSYQDFRSAEPYDIIIHPYFLKQYNNRWFLFGLNERRGIETWNLPLDRIKSVKETTIEFKPTSMNWKEYFDDFIGVTKKEGEVETVELLFAPEQAPYILTKPIHDTQKKKFHDERGLLVTIEVIPNFELEKLILSFGERVNVLSPNFLRNTIAERLSKASSIYHN